MNISPLISDSILPLDNITLEYLVYIHPDHHVLFLEGEPNNVHFLVLNMGGSSSLEYCFSDCLNPREGVRTLTDLKQRLHLRGKVKY